MSKIVTYHFAKSCGLGGVEALIRNLQRLTGDDFERYELFHDFNGLDYFGELNGVKYVKLNRSTRLIKKLFFGRLERVLFYIGYIHAAYHASRICGPGDVFFNFNPISCLTFSVFKNRESKTVYVQTNSIDALTRNKLWRLLFRCALKRADVFTVYTEYDREKLLRAYDVNPAKVAVIPRGCRIATAEKLAACSTRLVCVSRINEHQKNFAAMMEVMECLPSEYTLDIYGDGRPSEIEALNQLLERCPNVRFMGASTDMAKTLSNYAVFLMTSRYEGFGQSLIEARSQGLPIIAFDTFEALKWIVKDAKNGYVIKAFDIEDFARKVMNLTTNRGLYRSFSAAALNMAGETAANYVDNLWLNKINALRN